MIEIQLLRVNCNSSKPIESTEFIKKLICQIPTNSIRLLWLTKISNRISTTENRKKRYDFLIPILEKARIGAMTCYTGQFPPLSFPFVSYRRQTQTIWWSSHLSDPCYVDVACHLGLWALSDKVTGKVLCPIAFRLAPLGVRWLQ